MLHPHLAKLTPSDQEEVVQQVQREMAASSRRGLFAFPVAFILVALSAGGLEPLGPGFKAAGLVILLCTSFRALWVLRFETLFAAHPERWRYLFSGSLMVCAASWGFISTLLLLKLDFALPTFFALAITTAFVAQAGILYAFSMHLVTVFSLVLVLPLTVALFLQQTPKAWLGGVGCLIYLGFSQLSARSIHEKTWRSAISARRLEDHARELENTQESLRAARDTLEERVRQRTADYQRVAADLRGRERDYRLIFESAHDAILVFDPERDVIVNINKRACELYGFEPRELIGYSIAETLSTDPALSQQRIELAAQATEPMAFKAQHRTRDGRILTLEVNASVIEYQGRKAILSMNRDITSQIEQQELLLAKEAAERSNRAKSTFLANMSHEIRTPMAGVIGLADLMLKTELSRRQKNYAETIHSSSLSLLEVIDDILDFSKIEAGKLTLEMGNFDIQGLIYRILELLRPRAAARGTVLEATVDRALPARMWGAPARLRQVLLNLVGNAIKFTEEGRVEIRVERVGGQETDSVRQHAVRFSVRDTGIGMEPDLLPKLFQPFTQADTSTSRRFGGSGLGLAISQNLVGLMGGTIEAASTVGGGSTFSFQLTFEEAEEEVSSQMIRLVRNRKAARILVAEDNPVNQLVVLEQLSALGYTAEAVANGEEALRSLQGDPYDLVLMDCQMPGLDGYETTQRWRAAEQAAQTPGRGESIRLPIIALTAHAMKGDRERCLAAGMDDYLSKPFTENRLGKTLEKWLGGGY